MGTTDTMDTREQFHASLNKMAMVTMVSIVSPNDKVKAIKA
jgi:hypothetical protein